MNLIARIHDKEYEIAQGATFSEEYNETLDSGAIRIPHVKGQITNLRPYDDVYIYDRAYGFNENIAEWRLDAEYSDFPFYRHLLVDQYTEEVVNLDEGIFSYSIELFSETKGLEMVQLPNCSVTQPLNMKKKTDIYTYLCRFVDRYSPKYKTIVRNSSPEDENFLWTYAKKYSVSPELKEIFGGVYSQDFTLSNPTLRDVLSTLMITKDMIPYVKDDVIYAKAISERTGTYNINEQKNSGKINLVVGQMSSADYCDGVRRQYSDALAQDGTCNFVEYLGFRNKDNALMTLENMRLETTHKIYKIKKVHMCYYKKAYVLSKNDESLAKAIWFLCKQDITPLVKNSVEWGLLDQDWRNLSSPKTIKDISNYKISTVYYTIGSKTIEGWGTKYNEYVKSELSVYDITKTHIQNMIEFVDSLHPFGISNENNIIKSYDETLEDKVYIAPAIIKGDVNLWGDSYPDIYAPWEAITSTLKLKLPFFEIEYSGFYDGALIHSRDKGNDNLFQNDNQSSSLTLLEKDGFSQKEKLNRFANKTYTMKGRLSGKNNNVDNMLKLGRTGAISEEDDDVIIYRREYSIYDNYILVSYAGIQDYVLKNFYTSVYAKYRTYQLMSYGESVNRAENEKVMLLLSKDKKYKDESDTFLKIRDADGLDITNKALFSAFVPSSGDKSINTGKIILNEDKDGNKKPNYFVDVQTFTSGKSLCFNIAMDDNASGGTYLTRYVSDYQKLKELPSEDKDYYVGATQSWHNIVDDDETGEIKEIGFAVSHTEKNDDSTFDVEGTGYGGKIGPEGLYDIYDYSANLPKETGLINETSTNIIELPLSSFYKDNKDRIDMTLQIEPISDVSNDIVVGQHLMKLSDLISYRKYDTTTEESSDSFLESSQFIKVRALRSYDKLLIEIVESKETIEALISEIENEGPIRTYFSIFRSGDENKNEDGADSHFLFLANLIRVHYDSDGYGNVFKKIELKGYGEIHTPGYGTNYFNSMIFEEWPNPEDAYLYYFAPEYFDPYNAGTDDYNMPLLKFLHKHTALERNMFVEFNTTKFIDKTYSQRILPYKETDETIFKDNNGNYNSVQGTFTLNGETEDSYIRVNIPLELKESIKSVRYWYLDFDAAYSKSYSNNETVFDIDNNRSGYHFVFGVNIKDGDIKTEKYVDEDGTEKEKYYVDIYITKTTHRDPRIFDSVGRQVGVVHNCFDNEGNYEPPEYQQYDEAEGFSFGHSLTLRIEEALSGTVDGNGLYYPGEIANITATPANDSISFYRWKNQDGTIFSKNNNESFPMEDAELTLTAQFGKEYVIWKDSDNYKTFTTTDTPIEIYAFDDEQINGDILEITSGEDFVDVKWDGLLFDRNLKLKLDPITNNSYETAVDLFSGTVWDAELRVWFDNETKTIRCQGYRGDKNSPKTLTIRVPELKVALVYKPRYSKLVLDFSDEHIESITIATISAGEQTISRDNANIVNGKYVYKDENYPALATIYATSSVGYTTEYNSDNPLPMLLGTNLEGDTFAPTATELKLETPVLVSSTFEKRSYTDEQYRYEWDAIVKIKNTNNMTVSPNVDWAVSSGGHTFVPTSLDIAAGEEATFVCNTDMTSATLTISFSADGYKDSSELVVECGQSGGQE